MFALKDKADGRLGGPAGWATAFGSGHDPRALGWTSRGLPPSLAPATFRHGRVRRSRSLHRLRAPRPRGPSPGVELDRSSSRPTGALSSSRAGRAGPGRPPPHPHGARRKGAPRSVWPGRHSSSSFRRASGRLGTARRGAGASPGLQRLGPAQGGLRRPDAPVSRDRRPSRGDSGYHGCPRRGSLTERCGRSRSCLGSRSRLRARGFLGVVTGQGHLSRGAINCPAGRSRSPRV